MVAIQNPKEVKNSVRFIQLGVPASSWSLISSPRFVLSSAKRSHFTLLIAIFFALSQIATGWPHFSLPQTKTAKAATFSMQTGSYFGDGVDNLPITGVGFQPDFVMVKDQSAVGVDGVNFKTSVMSGEVSSVLGDADVDTASDAIQSFDSDGFTVGTDQDINALGVYYSYVAFDGSDCSSSGTFCVGSYTGNGTTQSLTSVGFQPALVMVKRSGASTGVWKTTSMPSTQTYFFDVTARLTDSSGITTLDSTGFSIGGNAAVNTNNDTYYFIAFKSVTDKMAVGSYVGNATDGADVTGFGSSATPDFVFVKAATTNNAPVFNSRGDGDCSLPFDDNSGLSDAIQALQPDGFDIGTSNRVNSNGSTYYWAGFAEVPAPSSNGATYDIQTGYYVGDGVDNRAITGVGFRPDLVIVKGISNLSLAPALKTSVMARDLAVTTSGSAAANIIQSLDADGFTVGTSSSVNTALTLYYWTAVKGSDCSSSGYFCVGGYVGSGASVRLITKTGFQPDFVMTKSLGIASGAAFQTSSMPTNTGEFVSATAAVTDGTLMQSLQSGGFQVGTNSSVNSSTNDYIFFAFRSLTNKLKVGTYTGDGTDNRDITGFGSGATPNFVFVKGDGLTSAMGNNSEGGEDISAGISSATAIGDAIQKLQDNGFQVGTNASVNTSSTAYYWVAFGGASAHGTASGDFTMSVGSYTGNGSSVTVSGLDFQPDLIILKSVLADGGAVFTTKLVPAGYGITLDVATGNITSNGITIASDGFSVGSNASVNTSGSTYYYEAFGNAYDPVDHSGASNFAIGAYASDGVDDRDIDNVGIAPDYVAVTPGGIANGFWCSSAMSSGQSMRIREGEGANADAIQALSSTGFQLGTQTYINGSTPGTKFYFAFKNTAGKFHVDTYTGNTSDDRSITGAGFQPDYVWVRTDQITVETVHRNSTLTGDDTQTVRKLVNKGANYIQAFESDGFQIGTNAGVNSNGNAGYYAAWKSDTSSLTINSEATGITLNAGGPGETTSDYTFSTSEEVIIDATSTTTWDVTVDATDFTVGLNTISKNDLDLGTDGTTSAPTIYSTTGTGTFTEPNNGYSSMSTTRTLMSLTSGSGTIQAVIRPTFRMRLPVSTVPDPGYSSTLTFTVI